MSPSILIVDDEPNIVMSLEFLMRRDGYDVQVARSGDEALDALSNSVPDLVLLDIMIPGPDGYEICKKIRANPDWCDIPVIMLTAKGREAERERGLAAGATDFVTKPFSTREFVDRVTALIENAEKKS